MGQAAAGFAGKTKTQFYISIYEEIQNVNNDQLKIFFFKFCQLYYFFFQQCLDNIFRLAGIIIEGNHKIYTMLKNSEQLPNQMEMSIYTFTHDTYILELPPIQNIIFYRSFPFYRDRLDFRGNQIKSAPVVRIYGTNQYSQKCCCHVHGFFPFLYIKADQFEETFRQDMFLLQFLSTLETLYQQAFRCNKPVVFRAQAQQKLDFYGYHTKKEAFLKLYLHDPAYITNMRQLLSSRVIINKSFQCYEAHINYYMQFFSEFNIYGINQMKICGFTFRKNYTFMPLFQKLSARLDEGIVHRGWNLAELQLLRPECFNGLHKTSTCYVQIDFQFHSILNTYEDNQSDLEEIQSSDQQIIQKANGFRKLKVTITKALQEIWRDQRKRRTRFQVRKTLEGVIDLTKNIECSQQVERGEKDPLWINFLEKGDNGVQLLNMLRSHTSASERPAIHEVITDHQLCNHYQQAMKLQRQNLINKVSSRVKYYQTRKNRIISEIMNGERGELPDWSDDQLSESSQESDNSDDSVISQAKSEIENSTKYKPGNTLKYRNNFKFELGGFKSGSLFLQCKICRNKVINCECNICIFCGEEDCSCETMQHLRSYKQNQLQIQQQFSTQILQYEYQQKPPSFEEVKLECIIEYQKPFYSNIEDFYQHYKLGNSISFQPKYAQYIQRQVKNTNFFNREPVTIENKKKLPHFFQIQKQLQSSKPSYKTFQLQYMISPPTYQQILKSNKTQKEEKQNRVSSMGKCQDTFIADLLVFDYQLLIDIPERNLYYGNPQKHQIFGIIFQIYNQQFTSQSIKGAVLVQNHVKQLTKFDNFDEILLVKDERSLLSMLINIVFRVDVDIFMSWDMQKKGVRYLMQRGIANGINMSSCLSRVNDLEDLFQHINLIDYIAHKQTYLKRQILTHGNVVEESMKNPSKDNTYYLNILNQKLKKRLNKKPILRQKYLFDFQIKGRVNINLHRICEMQMKLRSYSLQSVVKHLFETQIADFTDKHLFIRFETSAQDILNYILQKIQYHKLISHELNIIGGIVQKSKIYGADFLSMMERGSQFKIESIMCRTAKQNGYLTLSATKAQVANQSLLQCRPFVLQPPKQFYSEPVLLFDFQSLYPSVMIAYNLCYSTCLGSIKQLFKEGKIKRLGVSTQMTMHLDKISEFIQEGKSEKQIIRALSNYIFVTPNKVAFVKKSLKQGIIPNILLEFLISRIMIKDSTKLYQKQSIKKTLKQRQMALKLFMNVMFGYTGASFSGRMPCSEIADSVVQISKYCLRKSIDYLNNHQIYKGKVLYGDTDSIFFHLPNVKLADTFEIGKRLADQITKMFPYPMQMKFQKVYESLFLVSKKRYYGKCYESFEGKPKYQGKGLETVRRDGIQFTSLSMARILNKLIDTKDLSQIKELILHQSKQLLAGNVDINEICLAKEVKLLKYSNKTCPAHGQAAKKLENIDPMLIPKYGERLKYVVIQGIEAIKNRAIPLFEYMLHQQKYHLDFNYYYTKLYLPPLRRTLISLVNLDEWGLLNQFSRERNIFEEHKHKVSPQEIVCGSCLKQELQQIYQESQRSDRICRKCTFSDQIGFRHCVEWNCSNLYKRKRANELWVSAKQRGDEIVLIKQLLSC